MFKSSSGYINLTYLLVLLFGLALCAVIIQEALSVPLTLKATAYKPCIPLHSLQAQVLLLVVAAVGVFCHVLQGRALSLVIPAVVLRHILQGRRLSIGGDNGSGSCSAFVPVFSEVVVVVGQVYLQLLYPLKVVSGKIFSEKLALLEFKNSVSNPFRPDGLNHCSGSGVRCSLDSRIVTIKIDSDGRDEDEGAYQKRFGS